MKRTFFRLIIVLCAYMTFVSGSLANNKVPYDIGVNRFAWYASLQLINFMPIASADPLSGVIITDWYSITDNERYKLNVYVVETALTSQTVEVKVFKQEKQGSSWVDTKVPNEMNTKLEDAILNLSRQLRVQHLISEK